MAALLQHAGHQAHPRHHPILNQGGMRGPEASSQGRLASRPPAASSSAWAAGVPPEADVGGRMPPSTGPSPGGRPGRISSPAVRHASNDAGTVRGGTTLSALLDTARATPSAGPVTAARKLSGPPQPAVHSATASGDPRPPTPAPRLSVIWRGIPPAWCSAPPGTAAATTCRSAWTQRPPRQRSPRGPGAEDRYPGLARHAKPRPPTGIRCVVLSPSFCG